MPAPSATRAAQYLRMSTEQQRYSLAAQAQAIGAYAQAHGLTLTTTYFDPGESGVTFDNRPGLQSLLLAALAPDRDFDTILVLDVSRWGRFQDIDQPAHYEYLCRSAGVRVVYCAEPFIDDQSPVASLLKTLKRIMAAEFSRDLSAKTRRAYVSNAKRGFFLGGRATYGVRRVLVGPDGERRLDLAPGERKALAFDRVVLRRQADEAIVVRRIFRRYVRDERSGETIARELNRDHIPAKDGGLWTGPRVLRVLRNPLTIGLYVVNKMDKTFRSAGSPRPQQDWVRVQLFAPIVSPALFRRAQQRLARQERERLLKPEMLRQLKALWRKEGRLNGRLINARRQTPCAAAYVKYFGSLLNAYAEIGYAPRFRGGPKPASREQLLRSLIDAHARHGHLTVRILNHDAHTAAVDTYRKYFGSMRRAYELAGLPHTRSELSSNGHRRSRLRRDGAAPRPADWAETTFSNEDLLAFLRDTYARRGNVSQEIIDGEVGSPPLSLFAKRFGCLSRAYVLAGLPDAFLWRYRLRRYAEPYLGGRSGDSTVAVAET